MKIDSFHAISSLMNKKGSGTVSAAQNESPAHDKPVITTELSVGTPSVGTPSVGTPSVGTPSVSSIPQRR